MSSAIQENIQDKFEFSEENEKKIKEIFAKYPDFGQRSATLPLLDLAQRQNGGWLSDSALAAVAEKLQLPKLTVKSIASFYTMFHLKPVGKNVIEICKTLSCKLRGAGKIQKAIEEKLNIKLEETDENGDFTFLPCECLGACVNAPVVKINDDYYEDLTPEDITKIIDELKSGKKPKIGSYKNRQSSEPS